MLAPTSFAQRGLVPAAVGASDGGTLGGAHADRTESSLSSPSIADLCYLVDAMLSRLREPVRLEVRLLDDRVIARRLDGNRAVDVDLSRGYRMVGYISV